jgi:ATP-dependent Lon protease
VGGIREKLIAARRAGLKEIILPADNEGEFDEVPEHVRKGLNVHFATHFDDVVPLLFRTKVAKKS